MRTEDLEVLVKIADTGSLSGAAKALAVPKSTVSRRLARLESELGMELLRRTSRATTLTDVGELVARKGGAALAELESLRQSIAARSGSPTGRLYVSAPADIGAAYLGPMCAAFGQAHPGIEIVVGTSAEYVDFVTERFDVSLRASVGPLPDSSSLRARKLSRIEVGLWAAPSWCEQAGDLNEPADLEEVTCASMSVFERGWDLHDATANRTERVEVAPTLVSNDHLLLREAAREGAGVVCLPNFVAACEVGAGRLVRVLPSWSLPGADIYAIWPLTQYEEPRVRLFVDALAEYFERNGT